MATKKVLDRTAAICLSLLPLYEFQRATSRGREIPVLTVRTGNKTSSPFYYRSHARRTIFSGTLEYSTNESYSQNIIINHLDETAEASPISTNFPRPCGYF